MVTLDHQTISIKLSYSLYDNEFEFFQALEFLNVRKKYFGTLGYQ